MRGALLRRSLSEFGDISAAWYGQRWIDIEAGGEVIERVAMCRNAVAAAAETIEEVRQIYNKACQG